MPAEAKFHIPAGGLFFWGTLPKGFYSMNLYHEALKRGVHLVPGDLFYPDRRPSPCFRLSIAEVEAEDIGKGVEILSEVISKLMEDHPIGGIGPRPLL